ncbi:MAG: efflux RND transporter periplasmic adaptor subunit [Halioglobus sp.]
MKQTHRLHRSRQSTIIGIALAIGFTTALSAALYARANTPVKNHTLPLPVAAEEFIEMSGYEHPTSYLGLVQAGRKSDIGFELSGLVANLHVSEGSVVERGEILGELDNEKLQAMHRAAAADLKRVEAELELAKLKEKRHQDLQKTGAVSREAHDESRLRSMALAAQSDVVQAQLEAIEIDLRKTLIRAPYAGMVSEHYIDIGTVVAAGTPILRLVETTSKEAHIGIPVTQSETLSTGEKYRLTIRGELLDARLLALRPDVNSSTRAVTAVFAIPPGVSALDGEPTTMHLTESVAEPGGWLPLSALLEGERGAWIVLKIVASSNGQHTLREAVEVLEVQNDNAFVRGTIANGDIVVANGVHKVTPGAAVVVVN